MDGTYRVIITVKNYEPIVKQLEDMDIKEDSYRIFSNEIESIGISKMKRIMLDGKYYMGYTTGIFDSFKLGDLDLLKRSKSCSHYLIVGVFTDELLCEQASRETVHAYEERSEMIKQCKYVDQVIPIDSHNINVIDAWKELRFGCLFVDKETKEDSDKRWLRKKLYALGVALEFV